MNTNIYKLKLYDMKKTIYYCDTCGADTKKEKSVTMQVIFLNNPDGVRVDPYFSQVSMELCDDCADVAKGGDYIHCEYVSGRYNFHFKSSDKKTLITKCDISIPPTANKMLVPRDIFVRSHRKTVSIVSLLKEAFGGSII